MSLVFRGLVIALTSALSLGMAACSGDDSEGSGGAGATGGAGGSAGSAGTSGSAGSAGSAGSGGSGPKCPGPGYHEAATPQQVDSVTARVIDTSGSGVANIQATVCGIDICIYGSTDGQGNVQTCDDTLGVCTPGIKPGKAIKKPAFKFEIGATHVKWAIPLPSGATHAFGDVTTVKFPDISTGQDLTPGAELTSSGVTLSIPPDADIKIDILTYEDPAQRKYRAVEVPVASAPSVATGQSFVMIFGTTPVDTHFCPPAKLSVPNSASLPAGTAVEFWAHGVDAIEEWAPYAGWAKVSDGAVSADGTMVVTSDGQGVPLLGVFGIKQK